MKKKVTKGITHTSKYKDPDLKEKTRIIHSKWPVTVGRTTIHCGDSLEVMAKLPKRSVDAIVTDPPYGLKFAGKAWDRGVPGEPFWAAALRVAKPGTHLMAFGGSRTYHRLACAIEDAGWEIRDCIMWCYSSGFPKSLNVSKAIDKKLGADGKYGDYKKGATGKRSSKNINEVWKRPWQDDPEAVDRMAREYLPSSPDAKEWDGWGTGLKPSYEPIILARKPLNGTVAENVMKYGTGGINIDACRVGESGGTSDIPTGNGFKCGGVYQAIGKTKTYLIDKGKWPANLIHDGSQEVVSCFPEKMDRIFYTAKAPQKQKTTTNHPTVKPLDLMRYLIRLVTPFNGVVLDPFAGSGSTLRAASFENCDSIGIELSEQYCNDFIRRMK